MSPRIARTIALSLALLGACDGLGQPVVDRRHGAGGRGGGQCVRRRPRCDDQLGAPEQLDVGVALPIAGSTFPPCALAAGGSARRIMGLFHECTLALDASQGEEREIAESSLDNVLIQLDGAVQLRISHSELFRVTVQSAPATDSEAAPVLQITHSDLRRSAVRAELLELTTCFFDNVDLETSELSAVDVEFDESYLRARQATISAAHLDATHFGGCETLLLAGSKPSNSRFDACAGVTRIYDVEATGCTFDGQLESDDSTFADGRFGVHDPTQLHSWDSTVDNTAFCAEVDGFRFSAGAIVCSTCRGALATSKADACFDTAVTSLEENECKAFEIKKLKGAADAPETCDTFPRRERPNISE